MRSAVAAMTAGAALGLALTGCADSASDQIRATVELLAQATGRHEYRTICERVLAPALVAHLTSNGIPCVNAMRFALGGVHSPVVSIGKITVRGRRAAVVILTVAKGQRASLNALELLRTTRGWRISALASPLNASNTG